MFSKDLAAEVSNPHDKQEIVSILPYFELSYPDGQAVELKYGLTFSQMVPIRQETKSRIHEPRLGRQEIPQELPSWSDD